jgi:hypothetical protein
MGVSLRKVYGEETAFWDAPPADCGVLSRHAAMEPDSQSGESQKAS